MVARQGLSLTHHKYMTYKQCADALKTSVEERVDIEDELYPDRVHITARLGLLGLARAYMGQP